MQAETRMATAMGPATAGNTQATEKTSLATTKTTKAVALPALPTAETQGQEQHDTSKHWMRTNPQLQSWQHQQRHSEHQGGH
jgi:hypothetical protein